jgi:hypothetical protein
MRRSFDVCEYMSSMNRSGIPDLHVVVDGGRSCWLELKFVGQWPADETSNALRHKFSPQQMNFLRRTAKAGGLGMGVVGYKIGRDRVATFLRQEDIREDGGVTKAQLLSLAGLPMSDRFFPDMVRELLIRS